ncbi:nuclear pore complex protein Nup107 [Cylas formicarius]|uniref:nuclear pore complex protein Nup107 n=1 Tax=Cylas formicarius TaxID=197179 RepID=UPI0029583B21|nr:nuclear pore complex protein Nup107 [Cylas formicarius]
MEKQLHTPAKVLGDVRSPARTGLLTKKFNVSNISIKFSSHELELLQTSQFRPNDTTFDTFYNKTVTGEVIQANAPWKTTVDSLYTEFFEILQGTLGSNDVLEVVSELGKCCSDSLNVLRSMKEKVAIMNVDEEEWLEKERDTWRLMFILYQDRLVSQSVEGNGEIIPYFGRSEKNCVESLFKRESLVRECQLVIDWLECQAAEKDDQVLHFSDSSVGWENTLHQLQSADTIAFQSSRQVVDKLDPDSVHYQWKPLHDLDTEDEKKLNRKIFQEIRCGKLEEAQKLARQCGHAWKAAIFEGWRLFHDPNIKENYGIDQSSDVGDGCEEMDSNELKEIEGNLSRDIWKIMALRYCKQDYISALEKASVGSFCGCINAMLAACSSWEDGLWAYMKSMVDIRVESEVRDCCTRDNPYLPLPEEYWAQRMSLNDVFANLESSNSSVIREASCHPQHVIQKYIILDEIYSLLCELEEWCESASTQFLRFAAHLALFLDHIKENHSRDKVENVIKGYIRRLMNMNETRMVAFYVSKLSPGNQVQIYAEHCQNILDDNERKEALDYASSCGLDVFAITKQIVENIRNLPQEIDARGNLQQRLTETDKLKICALDWLMFDEDQRLELIVQSNAIIFSFLTLGKVDAAQMAFNKLPSDSIEDFLEEIKVSDKNKDFKNIIKEHQSYKAYLEAHEAFNEWFKNLKNKPIEPATLSVHAQFAQKVAHQHKISQYMAELERWRLSTAQLAKIAKALLYNILLFPGGWLEGAKDGEYLRSIVIPEVMMLLYSVLVESDMREECSQLVDVLASKEYQLYKAFSKELLGDFLMKIGATVNQIESGFIS